MTSGVNYDRGCVNAIFWTDLVLSVYSFDALTSIHMDLDGWSEFLFSLEYQYRIVIHVEVDLTLFLC